METAVILKLVMLAYDAYAKIQQAAIDAGVTPEELEEAKRRFDPANYPDPLAGQPPTSQPPPPLPAPSAGLYGKQLSEVEFLANEGGFLAGDVAYRNIVNATYYVLPRGIGAEPPPGYALFIRFPKG